MSKIVACYANVTNWTLKLRFNARLSISKNRFLIVKQLWYLTSCRWWVCETSCFISITYLFLCLAAAEHSGIPTLCLFVLGDVVVFQLFCLILEQILAVGRHSEQAT